MGHKRRAIARWTCLVAAVTCGFFVACGLLLSASAQGTTCDTWSAGTSADWSTAGDWSSGLPGSSDDVCFPAGSYTVTVTGESEQAASVTVGAGVTLEVVATQGGGSTLTLNSGTSTNSGELELSDSATSSSNQQALLQLDSGANLTNDGSIVSDPGAGGFGTRVINSQDSTSTILNSSTGTITVNYDLQIDNNQQGVFTTDGGITIASGQKLLVDPAGGGGTTLNLDGGTITDDGTFGQGISESGSPFGGATLNVSGGSIVGSSSAGLVSSDNQGSLSFSGQGSGTYTLVGGGCACNQPLSGTIDSNQKVVMSASAAEGGAVLGINSDVTNDGTIELTDPDATGSDAAEISIASGDTLTNDGSILSDPGGGGGTRVIAGSGTLLNDSTGTITVNQDLQVDNNQAGVFTNNGGITISADEQLEVDPAGGAATLNLEGGTIADNGTFTQGVNGGGATLNVTGGQITGAGLVADDGNGSVSFNGQGSGTYTFDGAGCGCSTPVSGTIGSEQTVVASASNATGGGVTLGINSNVTNDGTLELTDPDTTGNSQEARVLIGSGDTLTNDGTILSDGGGVGTRVIDGSGTFLNDSTGSITVNQDLQIDDTQSGVFTSKGAITINSGEKLLIDPSGDGTFSLQGGTITDDGTFAQGLAENGSAASGGTLNLSGGPVVTGSSSAGLIIADEQGSVSFSGQLKGNFTFEGEACACSTALTGTFQNQGTLNIGAVGASDVDVTIPAGSVLANTGTLNVLAGNTLTDAGTVTAATGTISVAGTFAVSGTFNQQGARTTGGTIQITGGELNLEGTGQASFKVPAGSSPSLTGNVAPGQSITVDDTGDICGGTILTSNGAFTNAGTINFVSNVCPSGGAELVTGGTLTNTGTIDFATSSGGGGEIAGPVTNTGSGVIDVDDGGANKIAGTLTNDGTLTVNWGTLTLTGLSNYDGATYTLTGGSYQVLGSSGEPATLNLPGGLLYGLDASAVIGPNATIGGGFSIDSISQGASLTFETGSTPANFLVSGELQNSGNLVLQPGVTMPIADYTQEASGTLTEEIGGTSASGDYGVISSTGQVSLDGTLAIQESGGFTPNSGDTYTPITGSPVSGTFSTVTGKNLGSGLAFSVGYTSGAVQLTAGPGVDMTASNVTGTSSPSVGQTVTVNWTVTANGSASVPGSWSDAVYLSPGTTVTSDSVLLGTVAHTGGLAGGQSYNGSLTLHLPGVVAGTWHYVVVTDAADQTGDLNTAGQTAASGPVNVTMPQLTVGGSVSGTIPANGDAYFEVRPTPGTNVQLSATFAGEGAASMAVAFGQIPSPGSDSLLDCGIFYCGYLASNPIQTLAIPFAQNGAYYVDLNDPTSAPETFNLSATSLSTVITSVTPNHAAYIVDDEGDCAGNCYIPARDQPDLSVAVSGVGFTPASTASLSCQGRGSHAGSVDYVNSTLLYVDFGPTPVGQIITNPIFRVLGLECDVTVQTGASTSQDNNAITIGGAIVNTWDGQPFQPIVPQVSVVAPSINRENQESFVEVDYRNPYSFAIPAPLMELDATGATLHYPDLPAGHGSSLPLLGVSSTGDPGVLGPGQSGSLQVAFDSTVAAHQTVSFDLKTLDNPTQPAFAGDLFAELLPAGTDPSLLAYIRGQYANYDGAQLQGLLDSDATYLASIGEPASDTGQLFGYELNKLTNYGAMVADRQDGPLGVGLPPLLASASADSAGDVTVTDRNGNSTVFMALPSGGYASLPGVQSTLASAPGGGWVMTQPDGSTATFNSSGQLVQSTDRYGNTANYTYTAGNLTGVSTPDGDQVTLAYDGNGHVTSISDARTGLSADYAYDSSGHLASVTSDGATAHLTWNENTADVPVFGKLASVTDGAGVTESFTYDTQGRLTRVTRSDGTTLASLSYPSSTTVDYTNSLGDTSTESLDATGTVVSAALPDGTVASQQVNSAGQTVRQTLGNASSVLGYDSSGDLITAVDPAGNQTALAYSSPGELSSLTEPNGALTLVANNPEGDPTTVTDPAGNSLDATYTATGRIATDSDRDGDTAGFTYDSAGDITEQTLAGGVTSFSYDANHNLISASDSNGTTSYTYNADNQLTGVTYPTGLGLTFTYDAAGRRTSATTSDGYQIDYHYNAAGLISELTDGSDNTIASYAYNGAGLPTTITDGDGATINYTYDNRGEVASVVNKAPGGSVTSQYTYGHNPEGETTSITSSAGAATYGYDADGQLTSAALPGGRTLTYTYESAGDRTATTDTGGSPAAYTVGADGQYTSVGGTAYGYDNDGRLTSAGSTTYAWTPRGELASSSGSGGTTSYTYDALGNLVAQDINGTTTEVLPDPVTGVPLASYDSNGNPLHYYPSGVGVVGQVSPGGSTDYYGYDGSGNVVALSGPSGALLDTFQYLPFGQIAASTGSTPTPFGFAGEYGITTDPVTGFTRNGVREYDPVTGRFISQDSSLLSAPNPYEYAGNDPLDNVDLTGQDSIPTTAAGGGPPPPTSVVTSPNVTTGLTYGGYVLTGVGGIGTVAEKTSQFIQNSNPAGYLTPSETNTLTNIESTGGTLAKNVNPVSTVTSILSGASTAYTQASKGDNADAIITGANTIIQTALPTPYTGPVLQGGEWVLKHGSNAIFTDLSIVYYAPKGDIFGPGVTGTSTTRGPHDPNDMVGPTGYGPKGFIPGGMTMPYQVDFANLAAASLPAQTVTVTEPLDSHLNLSTFSLGAFGFGTQTVVPPPGQRSYTTTIDDRKRSGLYVKVRAALDSTTRTVTWTFTSIDPATGLPTTDAAAGFLPPDTKSPEGEGFVSYTVKPLSSVKTGTAIHAHATVRFDVLAPMTTSTVTNTIDNGRPTAKVAPLPVNETGPFTVHWSGTDVKGGSGIAGYYVAVSDNGGPLKMLETRTKATSTRFSGKVGHRYSFIAWAVDNVGNLQPQPKGVQASTTVVGLRLLTTSANVAHGKVPLKVRCVIARCSGRLTLSVVKTVTVRSNGKVTHKQVTVSYGSASYSAQAGRTVTVTVRLKPAGRTALAHAKGKRLSVTQTATVRGSAAATSTVTLRLLS
jgi:RHS repeat-associated protein